MQTNAGKKLPTDVVVLIESSPFIGVCYDHILKNYLKQLIQHFYGTSMIDDLGLLKDLSGVVFSAITYKGLTSLPSSICTHIQPTSHAKLFFDKLESFPESLCLEDQAHMAEGFALALDIFEDLENRRKANKSERVSSNRHIILVASQSAYEDVPIFESNNYRGLKFEEILQSLQKLQVNLSIISPNYSPNFVRLYEKVNNPSNSGTGHGEFRLEKIENFSFLVLLHNSVQLVDYEAQQKQLLQMVQQQKQQQAALKSQEIQQNQIPPLQALQPPENVNINGIKSEATPPILVPAQAQSTPYQMNPSPIQQQQQQQPQPPIQTGYQQYQQAAAQQQPKIQPQQPTTPQNDLFNQPQQQPAKPTPPPQMPGQPLNNPVQTQIQQSVPNQTPQPTQQPIIRPPIINVPQQIQPAQTQMSQQPQITNIRQIGNQVIQTPQNQTMMTTGQQPTSANYQQMNQPGSGIVQQPANQPNQYQQQAPTNFNYVQTNPTAANTGGGGGPSKQVQIWEGQIEWVEKDRNNPNIKLNHMAPAVMYSFATIDPATGQYMSEVPLSASQVWPPKIPLQMMSKQILDILSPYCLPPVRNIILYTENQDVKNALTNVGGALINFATPNISADIKVMLVVCQNNELICKIPSDPNKFLNALKQIISKQKQQQQQRMQQVSQPQQQQMIQQQGPPQIQMNQNMIQQPSQIMMQPNMQTNSNNWINVQSQMQQQQPQMQQQQPQMQQQPTQQQMYMGNQQGMMQPQQQQQQPPQQQKPQNFSFGGQNY